MITREFYNKVSLYIDRNYIGRKYKNTIHMPDFLRPGVDKEMVFADEAQPVPRQAPVNLQSIEGLMESVEETFSMSVLHLIDEKGISDVEVYKRAFIDRRLFSKIRCNPDYMPKKQTAIALAIGMELNLDETRDLLAKAGYALSHSSKADIITEFFISEGIYDLMKLNEVLYAFGQPIIGE